MMEKAFEGGREEGGWFVVLGRPCCRIGRKGVFSEFRDGEVSSVIMEALVITQRMLPLGGRELI